MAKPKRTNSKEAARRANKRAATARENSRTGAVVGVGATVAGALLAPAVAEFLPGPSAEKVAEWGKKKSAIAPLKSPRVFLPLGLGALIALFGGDGIVARAAAFTSGGMATAFYQATASEMGQVDQTAMAVEKKK